MKRLQISREIYNNQMYKVVSNWNYHLQNIFNGTTMLHVQEIEYQATILCYLNINRTKVIDQHLKI